MAALSRRLETPGLLILRVIIGFLIAAHGLQKLNGGPANFGRSALDSLGVPAPVLMGYVVTYAELAGGVLLIPACSPGSRPSSSPSTWSWPSCSSRSTWG